MYIIFAHVYECYHLFDVQCGGNSPLCKKPAQSLYTTNIPNWCSNLVLPLCRGVDFTPKWTESGVYFQLAESGLPADIWSLAAVAVN